MQNQRAIHPYLSPARPRIFAHRGFAAAEGLVENTIPAFEAAIKLGASHIESDIQVTSDGVPMLFHDIDLQRVAGVPRKVSELSAAEVAKIDLGGGAFIPTLKAALTALPDARFNLDLKVASAISPAIAVIRELEAQNRVLLTSFSDRRRKVAVRRLNASVPSSAGGSRVLALWFAAKVRNRWLVRIIAAPVVALQIPVASGKIRFDSPAFIAQMKRAGLEIHYWTINDSAEMQRLIDLGADGIVTDRTDIAVNTLRTVS
jgi:glycerophosphoryl diester phosphodiesterase